MKGIVIADLAKVSIEELDEILEEIDSMELDTDSIDETTERIATMGDLDDPWVD